jgi:glycine cleavage system regulatory protein
VAEERVGHEFIDRVEVALTPRPRLPLLDDGDRVELIGHPGSIADRTTRRSSHPHRRRANHRGAYDVAMTPLVLTLIGDDRSGLVSAIAAAVTSHGGNWERSQMAELAGKFAGIVLVTVPDERVDEFTDALQPLRGLLDVTVQRADGAAGEVLHEPDGRQRLVLDLLGTDRPGIVSDISAVLAAHDVNIETLVSATREAPMAGGLLFEATAELELRPGTDVEALRSALEDLANELMVDLDLDTPF